MALCITKKSGHHYRLLAVQNPWVATPRKCGLLVIILGYITSAKQTSDTSWLWDMIAPTMFEHIPGFLSFFVLGHHRCRLYSISKKFESHCKKSNASTMITVWLRLEKGTYPNNPITGPLEDTSVCIPMPCMCRIWILATSSSSGHKLDLPNASNSTGSFNPTNRQFIPRSLKCRTRVRVSLRKKIGPRTWCLVNDDLVPKGGLLQSCWIRDVTRTGQSYNKNWAITPEKY